MTDLPSLPTPPDDVRYALTVPQSVLFADLSLRGSTRAVFRRVVGIDYEPRFIAIDNGAMSWNFSPTDPFIDALGAVAVSTSTADIARKFIELMGRTSRYLLRQALILSAGGRRRVTVDDLVQDLTDFWNAYEAHMTSLFTFWNVETLLTDALVTALKEEGDSDEVQAGLPTFIRPSEPNWFALEQANLLTLKERFGTEASPAALKAAEEHVHLFGFLLAPFNLGSPPTPSVVLDRMSALSAAARIHDSANGLTKRSPAVRSLGELERQLSFWKTERLDAFTIADASMRSVYEAAADRLGLGLETVFCLCPAPRFSVQLL